MNITFKNGFSTTNSISDFLVKKQNKVFINAYKNNVFVNFLHGRQQFLLIEKQSNESHWTLPNVSQRIWLYWELNFSNLKFEYNYTLFDPFISLKNKGFPQNPKPNQIVFNTTENKFFKYKNSKWDETCIVFCASILNNKIEYVNQRDQLGLYDKFNYTGSFIFSSDNLNVSSKTKILKTDTDFIVDGCTFSFLNKARFYKARVPINFLDPIHIINDEIVLADCVDELRECHGLAANSCTKGDLCYVAFNGTLNLNLENSNILNLGMYEIWLNQNGKVSKSPNIKNKFNQYLGKFLSKNDILIDIRQPVYNSDGILSITPTVTPTPSITPSVTPTITPSVTVTPSIAPSVTPTITPSVTVTPSIAPSVTPTITSTPSESNVDPFLSNVVALLHFDGELDGSTNIIDSTNRQWTAVSAAQIDTNISRFGDGSLGIPNSGSYILGSSSGRFGFNDLDYTIEGFVYVSGATGLPQTFFDNRSATDQGIAIFLTNSAGSTGIISLESNSGVIATSPVVYNLNEWFHLAVCRSAGTVTAYVNGVDVCSAADSRTYAYASSAYIGVQYDSAAGMVGNIDELRITKGVARYTSNFSPPTQQFQDPIGDPFAIWNVALLRMDGPDASTTFSDEEGNTWVAFGGSQITTSTSKYGGASGNFATINDWISTGHSNNLTMGLDSFCFEGWFRPTNSGVRNVFTKGLNSNGGLSFFVSLDQIIFRCNGISNLSVNVSLDPNEFTHVAFVRYGSARRIYVNGVSSAFANDLSGININDTNGVQIGAVAEANAIFRYTGWIDDIRFTKGDNRYDTNFTPSILP